MILRFLGAVQFLTTVPVPFRTAAPGQSAIFFPLVGGALGAFGAVLFVQLRAWLPVEVASILVVAFWAVLTGGLHEDGFADVADALRAGRSVERILTILKDSRIGAHGALALIVITILRWQSLRGLGGPPVICLAAAFAVARASIVALAWFSPPAGGGLGFEFSRRLTTATSIAALAQALVFAYFAPAGWLLVLGACFIVVLGTFYFRRRIGGVNGDCMGATSLLVETWGMVLYACQRCI
jgi:adenosylcobinamide-GDP ribazoletransferase